MMELNKLYLMDCMKGMKKFPDNYFDLAIVDPPYTENNDNLLRIGQKKNYNYSRSDFVAKKPGKSYFNELKRISKNYIVWGGNYFSEYLQSSRGWIFWDKNNGASLMADGELAYTNFDINLKKIEVHWTGSASLREDTKGKIHITQKPVALYKWILKNYANPGDKILDTHVGSGSSLIAFINEGFDYIGFEIDKDCFESAQHRIKEFCKQQQLFTKIHYDPKNPKI